jgi:hypothetical protein
MKRSELKQIIKQILVEEGRAPGRPKFTEADVSYGIVFVGPKYEREKLNYPYRFKSDNVKNFYGQDPYDDGGMVDDGQYYIFDDERLAKDELQRLKREWTWQHSREGNFKILPIADLEDNDNKVFVRPGTLKRALAE